MRIYVLSSILSGMVLLSGCAAYKQADDATLQAQLKQHMPMLLEQMLVKLQERKHFGGRLLIHQPSKQKMLTQYRNILKKANGVIQKGTMSLLLDFNNKLIIESFRKSNIYDEIVVLNCDTAEVCTESQNLGSQQSHCDKLESYARQNGFDYTMEIVKNKTFFTNVKSGYQISLTGAQTDMNLYMGEVEQVMQELSANKTAVESKSRAGNSKPVGAVKNNYALCIGLARYKNPKFSSLYYADGDAKDLAGELKKLKLYKNNIKILNNENALKADVKSHLEQAKENDLIIFWSGRAYESDDIYLSCYDSKPQDNGSALSLKRIIEIVKSRNPAHVICILDLCSADGKPLDLKKYLNKLRAEKQVPKGWIFIASASPGRKTEEKNNLKNGVLTYCLLQGLRGKADGIQDLTPKDGKISLQEIYNYLSYEMPVETIQSLKQSRSATIITNPDDQEIWKMELQ